MPTKFFGRAEFFAREVIGIVDVLDANTADGFNTASALLGRAFLDLGILEDRLDDEIAALESGVVGGRCDQRKQLVLVRRRDAAFLDLLGDQAFGMRLALLGRFKVTVEQNDRNAGHGGHIGNASAHETGAENADFLELGVGDASRTPRALVQFLERDEQRADHRRGFLCLQDLREVALLDPQPRVERNQEALVDAFQDGGSRWIVAVGLAAQDRDRRRPEICAGSRIDRSAGQLEALLIPGLDWLQAVLDHRLGSFDKLRRLRNLVNKPHGLRLLRRKVAARGQHLQSALRICQPGHALRAARAREKADFHFGQRQLHLVGVRGNTAMAGKRQFEGAAHTGAVNRGYPRLAAGFQFPEEPGHAADIVEQKPDRLLFALALFGLEEVEHTPHHGQVRTAGETVLTGGDHSALDRRIGCDLVDDLVEFFENALVEDVHRLPGHVPGDQRDAIRIDVKREIFVAHRGLPFQESAVQVSGPA